MGGTLLKIRAWWETADKTTKTVSIVGCVLLFALLAAIFYFSKSPDMRQLFPPLEPTEQGRVIQKLQEMKIPYRQEQNGSIFAPAHLIPEIRAKLSMQGIPSSGTLGKLRLNEMSFTDPAPLQEEKIRIALEEELAKTIMMLDPVTAAKVHISPGSDSPFADSKVEPSASVVVGLKPGSSQPRETAEAIVTTLMGAVTGLKRENISVSDSTGVVLFNGKTEVESATGLALRKREAELAEAKRLKDALESMITQVVGPGKAIVSTSVEMNFDKEEVITRSETPTKSPVSKESVRETYSQGAPNRAGGPASSYAAPGTASSSAGQGSYSLVQEVVNNATVQEKSEKMVAPGKIIAARVSIMLDQSASASARQIEQFAINLIGADKDPENFKVSVTTSNFDKTAAENASRELAAVKRAQFIQQALSMIPIVALLIVGFLIVRSIHKLTANNRNIIFSAHPLPDAYSDSETRYEHPSPKRQLAASSLQEEDLSESAKKRAYAIKQAIPDVGEIPEKFNENLLRILKTADTRPESVALLIKSWMLEEVR